MLHPSITFDSSKGWKLRASKESSSLMRFLVVFLIFLAMPVGATPALDQEICMTLVTL